MPTPFQCTVVTPEQQLLDQQVVYVSLPAWDGQVGIQNQRAPLLVKLGFGPLTLTLDGGQKQTYFIGGGFAQVKDNVVTLLTDEAQPAGEIQRSEAEAALAEAQALKPSDEPSRQRRERALDRARALVAMAK